MQDEFLTAFHEARKLRAERDRTFELAGAKLTHRPSVAPEVPMRFQEVTDEMATWATEVDRLLKSANGTTPELPEQPVSEADLVRTYDAIILDCLEPDSHPAWAALRAPDAAQPMLGSEIYQLAVYLMGRCTSLPTDGLLGSSATQPETERTSKANSPSQGKRKSRASAPSS